jgi:SRSO17 transposase
MLEGRRQPYVLAVRSNLCLRFVNDKGMFQTGPAEMASELSTDAWSSLAAGEGTKGIRLYDWARITLPWTAGDGFERWVLIRRNRKNPEERAYYLVFSPAGTTLSELAGAAGLRWTIEECFQRAKEELGLDHCEARSWRGWHRHMTLCMAAAGFLARLSAQLRQSAASKRNERSPTSLAA